MKQYKKRSYRKLIQNARLVYFKSVVKETDLAVYAEKNLEKEAKKLILKHRGYLESYIEMRPEFAHTLLPWTLSDPAPLIVRDMIDAGRLAGVGPMAAVAGAVAESVGKGLLAYSSEVMMENGGDVFIQTRRPVTVGIFAGKSPLSMKIGIRINSPDAPMAVCTSSGTIGHSKSLGKADAVCVVSRFCALADAAATAVGNLVKNGKQIQKGIDFARQIEGVLGAVVVVGDQIGAWGDIELTAL
jgi:ApbE superfamily uncharacterized protein (UPF0280 family)